MLKTPIILAAEMADLGPGMPVTTCRGCARRVCYPGFCTVACHRNTLRRAVRKAYHKTYDAKRRARKAVSP